MNGHEVQIVCNVTQTKTIVEMKLFKVISEKHVMMEIKTITMAVTIIANGILPHVDLLADRTFTIM